MKTAIQPKWFEEAKVTCACGNGFTVGASTPEIHVDVCYSCHPFYTGQMKFLDSAGRVDAFKAKLAGAGKTILSKTEKRKIKKQKELLEEMNRPDSLADLRNASN